MERETVQIITPLTNKTITLKSYLTGREKRALTNVYLQGDITFDKTGQNIQGLKGSLMETAENLAISTVVVSFEGVEVAGIVDAVLDLPASDYTFVIAEINKVTSDKVFEEKKTI